MAKKRIIILPIRAGAGHLRAAQALTEVFKTEYPDVEVRNLEALALTNKAFAKGFSGGYEKLARDLPSVWGMIYERMEKEKVDGSVKKLAAFFDQLNSRPLWHEVRDWEPDAVICTHYFPAETMSAKRRKGKLKAPVFVTLTDYDIHTMWIQEGTDQYFVGTEAMAYALKAKGIGDAGVAAAGIPLMPVFSQKYPKQAEMRRRLGVNPDRKTVLVSAGGFGLGGVDKMVEYLAEAMPGAQILAIAGKNEELEKSLRKVAKKYPEVVVPFGFVSNMHELMAASDLAVCKPGGLTSSEALALGLPMVIFNPIPGQEERNAVYLLEQGTALWANGPAEMVYKASHLIADSDRLAKMREACRAIAKPRAAYDIAKAVMERIG